MPQLVTTLDAIVPVIEELASECGTLRVGVEGASMSGKSTAADRLAQTLGAPVIHTDEFYQQGVLGSMYQDGLRTEQLSAALATASGKSPIVIVEGLCLRETLEALGTPVRLFIYCRKLSAAGVWHQDPDFNTDLDPGSGRTQELIDSWWFQYHDRASPFDRADFVFEWSEQ